MRYRLSLQRLVSRLNPLILSPSACKPDGLPSLALGTIVFSLSSQALGIFLIGLILTIAFGVYTYFSYPQRISKYEEVLRQYETNRQKFLVDRET